MNRALLFLFSLSFFAPRSASAQAELIDDLGGPRGFGTSCLSPTDDGSSPRIELEDGFPMGLRFFDDTHSSLFVNSNGNITFSFAHTRFTPEAFPVADRPMIAPYWADVDTRPALENGHCDPDYPYGSMSRGDLGCMDPPDNGVWWHLEDGRFIATWDAVAHFADVIDSDMSAANAFCAVEKRMTFQVILTAVESCGFGPADFDVEFRYARCDWTTGRASGGIDGLGGTPAQIGFDAGNRRDFIQLDASRMENVNEVACEMSNVGEPGVWRFQIRAGVVSCPEAGERCDTHDMGVCARGVMQCDGLMDATCVPEIGESEERCDGVDNDCDGDTDEGDNEGLCGNETTACLDGVCREVCFEGGCDQGKVCVGMQCVDENCVGMECDVGLRCLDGTCVDACDGVTCPVGRGCVAGQCIDLCATESCDACTVCEDGACVPRCQYDACEGNEYCDEETSHCELIACRTVNCPTGQWCREGYCADSCEDAVCPDGEACYLGECIAESLVPPPDAGPAPDAGADGGMTDAGTSDSGDDATPGDDDDDDAGDDGCGCRVAGPTRTPRGLALLAIALAFSAVRRRRASLRSRSGRARPS